MQSRWCSDFTTPSTKDDAVPSIFQNAPSYKSIIQPQRRTTKATSACRRVQETTQLQQPEQSFIAHDDISSPSSSEVAEKLRSEPVPTGFTVTAVGESLLSYMLDIQTMMLQKYLCVPG
jgi:hypothetical protein